MGIRTRTEALAALDLKADCTDDEEIRKSYKKSALKWHPDKNNGSTEATLKFKEIAEAFHFLQRFPPGSEYDEAEEDDDEDFMWSYDDIDEDIPSFKQFMQNMFGFFSRFTSEDEDDFSNFGPRGAGAEWCSCKWCRRERRKEQREWDREQERLKVTDDEEVLEALRRTVQEKDAQAKEREAAAWERQLPRPIMVAKTETSITLNLTRGNTASQKLPSDCMWEICVKKDGGDWWVFSSAKGRTIVTVTGLEPGNKYHFRSRAGRLVEGVGVPRWSNYSVESQYATSGQASRKKGVAAAAAASAAGGSATAGGSTTPPLKRPTKEAESIRKEQEKRKQAEAREKEKRERERAKEEQKSNQTKKKSQGSKMFRTPLPSLFFATGQAGEGDCVGQAVAGKGAGRGAGFMAASPPMGSNSSSPIPPLVDAYGNYHNTSHGMEKLHLDGTGKPMEQSGARAVHMHQMQHGHQPLQQQPPQQQQQYHPQQYNPHQQRPAQAQGLQHPPRMQSSTSAPMLGDSRTHMGSMDARAVPAGIPGGLPPGHWQQTAARGLAPHEVPSSGIGADDPLAPPGMGGMGVGYLPGMQPTYTQPGDVSMMQQPGPGMGRSPSMPTVTPTTNYSMLGVQGQEEWGRPSAGDGVPFTGVPPMVAGASSFAPVNSTSAVNGGFSALTDPALKQMAHALPGSAVAVGGGVGEGLSHGGQGLSMNPAQRAGQGRATNPALGAFGAPEPLLASIPSDIFSPAVQGAPGAGASSSLAPFGGPSSVGSAFGGGLGGGFLGGAFQEGGGLYGGAVRRSEDKPFSTSAWDPSVPSDWGSTPGSASWGAGGAGAASWGSWGQSTMGAGQDFSTLAVDADLYSGLESEAIASTVLQDTPTAEDPDRDQNLEMYLPFLFNK
eukprot:gene2468-3205_t